MRRTTPIKTKKFHTKYSANVGSPIYEPKNKKPDISELCDKSKTYAIMQKIRASNLSGDEKAFLINAAYRHIIFNYEKIADYYSHASKEMQELMEDSALVIIDFEKAISLGYATISKKIRDQYLLEYEK